MICSFIGYDSYGDEGKVMGLAPLGEDNYHDLVKDMVHITKEGFKLNSDWSDDHLLEKPTRVVLQITLQHEFRPPHQNASLTFFGNFLF